MGVPTLFLQPISGDGIPALMYIELKTGYTNNGPAWIGRVKTSKSGKTIYFNGRAFSRGNGVSGNHFDLETGDEYWISGVKKNTEDRHWAGSGKIMIEAAAIDAYLAIIGSTELDQSRYVPSQEIVDTDISSFHQLTNREI